MPDTIISNYGLFWRREWVYWGKPSIRGHLKGVLATNTTSEPVDFREQRGVYVLYDESFRLVYVGQAGANDQQRLFQRLKQHQYDAIADRWTRFTWYGIRWVKANNELAEGAQTTHPPIGNVLDHIEAILITAAEPPHNRQGGRFGTEAKQYLQYRDERLGPEMVEMVREIWEKHKLDQQSDSR